MILKNEFQRTLSFSYLYTNPIELDWKCLAVCTFKIPRRINLYYSIDQLIEWQLLRLPIVVCLFINVYFAMDDHCMFTLFCILISSSNRRGAAAAVAR